MIPTTKPDKKVPTHGPGTTAWYRGKEAKILAIENGKAKIFCDGRVLLVNYTSLDDASFKTLHEAYRVVNCDSHKALYTGTKDECESFISDECDEDANVECIKLKEAIMVSSDGMNPHYTLQTALSYAKGNVAAMIATNPLLYGISVLQRKYVVVCNVLDDEGTENPAYKKLDKEVRAKYHKLLSIPGESGKKYEVFGNKDNTSFLLYYEDAFTTNWFVPAAGKINESEAQDKYQEFFKKKLADYGVSSPAELSAKDKSKFFSEIKKEWPDAKVNEAIDTGMAFGVGSTVNYNGKNCKVVSIANGKCKLVCGGEVLYTVMDQLKPSTPVNESLNEAYQSGIETFMETLQKAQALPKDIYNLFAKEYFLGAQLFLLNEIVDDTLTSVDNSQINQIPKLAKKFNKGQYSDQVKNFIYFTNKLNDCRTNNLVFDQSYWDSCLALLIALGRSPMEELNEVNADSILFMPFKNTVTFVDLSASCVEAINNVTSKLPNCKIGKKTATKIDVIL